MPRFLFILAFILMQTPIVGIVERMIDGDTIQVLIGDRIETVRYIGVDTPETVHPVRGIEPYGLAASAFNRTLVEGRQVRLELDVESRDNRGTGCSRSVANNNYVTNFGNMREQELRDYVRDHLNELIPIHLSSWSWEPAPRKESYDALLELATVSGKFKAACEFVVAPTRAKIARVQERMARIHKGSDHLPLLISDYLSEPLQAFCREAGVPYLDLSGNAWIEHPVLVIHRSSQPPRFPTSKPDRTPFADKASLVLRFLFAEGQTGGVRELARSVGLNPGYVSRIIKAAEELGYVRILRNKSIRLVAPEEVLGDWASIYHWKRNRIRHFTLPKRGGEDSLLTRLKESQNAALTMHAGANLIDKYVDYRGWHIYCRTVHEQTALEKDLALTQVESGAGDVILMQPYYRESAFYGLRFLGGVPVVSDLQLYLDLFHFPVRGQETAERILTMRLRHKIPIHYEDQNGRPDDES